MDIFGKWLNREGSFFQILTLRGMGLNREGGLIELLRYSRNGIIFNRVLTYEVSSLELL